MYRNGRAGRKAALAMLLTLTLILLAACGSAKPQSEAENPPANEEQTTPGETTTNGEQNPIVTIEMDNGGIIKLELYPEVAPNTVDNFISLINKGFYDGLTFHRIVPGFVIQGGDPEGTGGGGPGYEIKGEFSSNGFDNTLKHTEGVLSMARTPEPDTAGSQFFIMLADQPSLDNEYAAFGKLTEGMDVVEAIAALPTNDKGKPASNEGVTMTKVTVDTFGETYPEPEKVQ
ncbi:peptidylprolyl isomerase [Saccharibacillus sp. CPCC 101409]|uniref:peptidylprolyl isomerase n=1 Tax=Saccharibacillus sp. CPCC 101409 TaxID=3058041 RepID=UPI002671482C|nr:peptidylprolyl isomerase [Saccharibacillus sp. CPCC 101409]MDO3408452.1 peptidylprolyl isomerase [Saccharibacillus sp. CPCC 101409]